MVFLKLVLTVLAAVNCKSLSRNYTKGRERKEINRELEAAQIDEFTLNDFIDDWATMNKVHDVPSSKKMTRGQRKLFKESIERVVKHNSMNDTWVSNLNHLSHLTLEEKVAFTPKIVQPDDTPARRTFQEEPSLVKRAITNVSIGIDWTNYTMAGTNKTNFISPVKDQGQCGSCFAFSATGLYEAMILIASKGVYNVSLSETYAMFLAGQYCGGGGAANVFQAVYLSDGTAAIPLESEYPYIMNATTLKYSASSPAPYFKKSSFSPGVANTDTWSYVRINNQTALQAALLLSPVLVSISVTEQSFYDYYSGIYYSKCVNNNVNHQLMVVGFNATGGYWKLKNSWGTKWGENGFMRVKMSPSDNYYDTLCITYRPIILASAFIYNGTQKNVLAPLMVSASSSQSQLVAVAIGLTTLLLVIY